MHEHGQVIKATFLARTHAHQPVHMAVAAQQVNTLGGQDQASRCSHAHFMRSMDIKQVL